MQIICSTQKRYSKKKYFITTAYSLDLHNLYIRLAPVSSDYFFPYNPWNKTKIISWL